MVRVETPRYRAAEHQSHAASREAGKVDVPLHPVTVLRAVVWIEPEGECACLALAVDEDRRLEGDLRRKAAPRDLPDAARDEQSRVRAEHERRELHQRV